MSTLDGSHVKGNKAKKINNLKQFQNEVYSRTKLHIDLSPDSFLGGSTPVSRDLYALSHMV